MKTFFCLFCALTFIHIKCRMFSFMIHKEQEDKQHEIRCYAMMEIKVAVDAFAKLTFSSQNISTIQNIFTFYIKEHHQDILSALE